MAHQGAGGFAAAAFRDLDAVRRGVQPEGQGHFCLNTCAHGEKRAILERIVQTGSDLAWTAYWRTVDKNYVRLPRSGKSGRNLCPDCRNDRHRFIQRHFSA